MKPPRFIKIGFFGAFLCASFLFAQSPEISAPLELHSGRIHILIPQRNEHGPFDWRNASCRGGIDHSILHADIRRGDTRYIVFTCEGFSRGSASSGGGGAGWEKQINWMAIRGGIVVEHQREDIESYWQKIYGQLRGWRGGVLVWSAEQGGSFDPEKFSGYFDPKAPQKGLQKYKNTEHQ